MKRLWLRPSIALTTAALVGIALTGCAGGASAGGGTTDRDIVIGALAEPEKSPDPIVEGSLAAFNYYYNLFDQLTTLDADGDVQASLATAGHHDQLHTGKTRLDLTLPRHQHHVELALEGERN